MDTKTWIEVGLIAIGMVAGWATTLAFLKSGQTHMREEMSSMRNSMNLMVISVGDIKSKIDVGGSQYLNLVDRLDEAIGGTRRMERQISELEKREAGSAIVIGNLVKMNDTVVGRLMEMQQNMYNIAMSDMTDDRRHRAT